MHTYTYICITYIHKYMHTYIVYPSYKHTHRHMQFSTALPCMLRGPASEWCGGMCGLSSGLGGNVGVALIMRMLISFNVGVDVDDAGDDERATSADEARWGDACWLSLTHTQPEQHTHTYSGSLSHRRPSSCCAYFKHTHTDWRQPFWLPHPLYLFLSLSPPAPVLVCIVENGFIENVVCFSIWFCSAAFSSSSSFFLSRFCFILYFYTIKYTWRGVSVCVCKCVHAFRRRVLCFPVPFLSFFLWLCLHFGVSASFWRLWTFSVFNFYVVHEL